MRIGIHAVPLLPYSTGRETYVSSLLEALAQVDQVNQYYVLVSPQNRHLFQRPEPNFHAVTVKLPSLPTRRLWEIAYLHLSPLVRGLDVIHLTEGPVPLYQPPNALAVVHDILPLLHPELFARKARLYYRQALSRGVGKLGAVIVASEQSKRDLIDHLSADPARITVIPLGVNRRFQPLKDARPLQEVRERYGLPQKFILYVGTIEPRKNLVRLIRACRTLRRRGLPHALVIAGGKGWLCDDVFEEAAREGANAVIFTGFVRDEDLPFLYNTADVFAYPSLYEGFGIPPLEAMASGIPVVCSNRASLPEVVGDAAFLVDPEDEREIASALEKVIGDHKLRARLRRAGLARSSLFSWENTARETLSLYESVYRTERGQKEVGDAA
jgi:glycosyltransferase involved in cell wall biosynthesis